MGEGWRFDAICIGKVKTRVLKPEAYGTRVFQDECGILAEAAEFL
jgi:hypothetical protein